jgi:hypothetical protein
MGCSLYEKPNAVSVVQKDLCQGCRGLHRIFKEGIITYTHITVFSGIKDQSNVGDLLGFEFIRKQLTGVART